MKKIDNSTPTVAVIMSVYQKEKAEYLRLSTESILNQTYSNIMLYIGVDGPIGEELKYELNSYEKQDRVKVVWFQENRGLACVLNDLLYICFKENYEYIARMDADDISVKDRIEKQLKYLIEHPDIDVVGGFSYGIDENGNSRNLITKRPASPQECYIFFAYSNPLSHPTVLFRKEFFKKAGLYRPEYRTNQDTLLWFDGLKHGVRMANLQEPVIYFRTTTEMLKNRRGGYKKAKKQFVDRLMINKELNYGLKANIYAFCIFIMMISPTFIRKIAYNIFKK